MKHILVICFTLVASTSSAASLSCFDEKSFGSGHWVKVDLRQKQSGKFDQVVEWSTGATVVTKDLTCRLAVIGSSPVLVDGSCERSSKKLGFQPGMFSGTMTIVENLSRSLGNAFVCEKMKGSSPDENENAELTELGD